MSLSSASSRLRSHQDRSLKALPCEDDLTRDGLFDAVGNLDDLVLVVDLVEMNRRFTEVGALRASHVSFLPESGWPVPTLPSNHWKLLKLLATHFRLGKTGGLRCRWAFRRRHREARVPVPNPLSIPDTGAWLNLQGGGCEAQVRWLFGRRSVPLLCGGLSCSFGEECIVPAIDRFDDLVDCPRV